MCRLFLPLLCLSLASCARETAEPRILASFQFASMEARAPWGLLPQPGDGPHRLLEGWETQRPKAEALWTLGDRAGVRFLTAGRELELLIRCSVSPEHVAAGQSLRVLWNGGAVDTLSFDEAWNPREYRIALPDSLSRDGWDELWLEPALTVENRGVYVYELALSARLSASEFEAWNASRRIPAPDPLWQAAPLRATRPSPRDPLPDILMLVLDAARPDHFSSYGYPRETTPFLAGLAAEGVQLEALFAEAPYTRNSVATIMSSLSWRDHQVLDMEDALAPQAVTLAEVLRAAGYATRGVSDNLQASKASGVDQGFDRFVPTWRRRKQEWNPEIVLDAFEELRASLPPDRPAFFYVHMLPPHEPYEPGPFDLWGPKDSPIQGSSPEIVEFDQGRRRAEGPDLQRLIARYDGGLRRGDEIARRLVESWQGRERPLWIVLLSDHGEAFGEHGRFGHNSTVFDEMLRVPGILWPREAFAFLEGSESALRSVGDIAPLLLHATGIEPSSGRWPARFAEVLRSPEKGRREIIAMAVGQEFGLRTAEGELLRYRARDRQELLRVQEPWTRTRATADLDREWELRLRLWSFVENSQALGALREELSEEERRELEALGYL